MAQRERPTRESQGISRRGLLALFGGVSVSGLLLGELLSGDVPVPVASSTPLLGPKLPKVLPCLGWDAREPTQPVTVIYARPDKILVHHTASPNEREGELSLGELARAIQRSHIEERGWIDSGHNFLVNRAGLIAEGRHRSLEMLLGGQHLIQGAHCTGQNTHSIGIENEGTYTEADPPEVQLATLRALCAFSCLSYRIRPSQIYGHRDFADTACPGDRLYALLPSMRVLVTRLLVGSLPLPKPPPAARAAVPLTPVPGLPAKLGVPGLPAKAGVPRTGVRPGVPRAAIAPFMGPGAEPLEPGYLEPHVVSPPTWPLLRIADRGPIVLAAQHLLRAAGMTGVPADGAFGRTTADGVFAFQRGHGLDLTGMIGGGSWPLLAVPVRIGQGGEADLAAQVLLKYGPGAAESVPRTVQRDTWQRLLGTG
jgi:hypothetical protein